MKKQNIIYKGNQLESLWGALGYLGPLFLYTFRIDKTSIFLKAHAIRSAIIFILAIIITIPSVLIRINGTATTFSIIYMCIGFVLSIILLIIYCKSICQSANGIYKKTLIDKLFGKQINKYLINKFIPN